MTLREKQSLFAKYFGMLILWAYENGYELTFGEGLRTMSQQLLYFEGYDVTKIGSKLVLKPAPHRSKTLFSKHLDKLAHDINVFKDGKLLTKVSDIKPLGDFWKSLDKRNVWGGDWGWDAGHVEFS